MRKTFLVWLLIFIGASFALFVFKILNLSQFAFQRWFIFSDVYTYIEAATDLYSKGNIHPYRPLGISVIVGLPSLLGRSLDIESVVTWMIVFNITLWFSTIIIVYKSLKILLPIKLAFFGSCCYIFLLGNLLMTTQVLTETVTYFLFTLVGYFLARLLKYKNEENLWLATFAISFIPSIRPGALILALIFLTLILVRIFTNSKKVNLNFKMLLVLPFTLILINMFMMKQEYGRYKLSYIGDSVLYYYFGSKAEHYVTGEDISFIKDRREVYLKSKSFKNRSEYVNSELITNYLIHPISYFKAHFHSLFKNSVSGNLSLRRLVLKGETYKQKRIPYWMYRVSQIQNILFSFIAFACVCYGIYRRFYKSLSWLLVTLCIMLVFATSALSFWQGDRFHLVCNTLIIILLGFTIFLKKEYKGIPNIV